MISSSYMCYLCMCAYVICQKGHTHIHPHTHTHIHTYTHTARTADLQDTAFRASRWWSPRQQRAFPRIWLRLPLAIPSWRRCYLWGGGRVPYCLRNPLIVCTWITCRYVQSSVTVYWVHCKLPYAAMPWQRLYILSLPMQPYRTMGSYTHSPSTSQFKEFDQKKQKEYKLNKYRGSESHVSYVLNTIQGVHAPSIKHTYLGFLRIGSELRRTCAARWRQLLWLSRSLPKPSFRNNTAWPAGCPDQICECC